MLLTKGDGWAVAGEDDGLIRQRGEGGAQVAQGLLIDGGRDAAADLRCSSSFQKILGMAVPKATMTCFGRASWETL